MSEERAIESMSHRQLYEELRCHVNAAYGGDRGHERAHERASALVEALFAAAVGDRDEEADTSAAIVPAPPRGSHEEAWREAAMETIAGQFFLYTKAPKRSCYSFAEAIINVIEARVALYDRERHYSSAASEDETP